MKYQELRDALPELVAEASRQGGINPRAQMIIELLAERDVLRDALSNVIDLHKSPNENWNEQFERVGHLFHKETGILRPGKDASHECGFTYEEREIAFANWVNDRFDAARAALSQGEQDGS